VLGSFIFLSLIIAVILENFALLGHGDPAAAAGVSEQNGSPKEEIENFERMWNQFAPGTYYLLITTGY
jgi:hypothetical protein